MAKKESTQSAGIHSNVTKKTRNAVRRNYINSNMRPLNQQKALSRGKDIVITIENPNKTETNKPFIRVRVSGKGHVDKMKNKAFVMKEVS
jgi:ribonuclease P protein component